MKVSTRFRYGLRAVVDMVLHSSPGSGQGPARTLSLGEVARRQGIPADYLRQIFLALKRAGILRSSRGRAGGYRLARPPSDVTALEIAQALGEDLDPVFCVSSPERCRHHRLCPTRPLWKRLQAEARNLLAAITVEQLAREAPREGTTSLPTGYMFHI